jgi:hypothetical protein
VPEGNSSLTGTEGGSVCAVGVLLPPAAASVPSAPSPAGFFLLFFFFFFFFLASPVAPVYGGGGVGVGVVCVCERECVGFFGVGVGCGVWGVGWGRGGWVGVLGGGVSPGHPGDRAVGGKRKSAVLLLWYAVAS